MKKWDTTHIEPLSGKELIDNFEDVLKTDTSIMNEEEDYIYITQFDNTYDEILKRLMFYDKYNGRA